MILGLTGSVPRPWNIVRRVDWHPLARNLEGLTEGICITIQEQVGDPPGRGTTRFNLDVTVSYCIICSIAINMNIKCITCIPCEVQCGGRLYPLYSFQNNNIQAQWTSPAIQPSHSWSLWMACTPPICCHREWHQRIVSLSSQRAPFQMLSAVWMLSTCWVRVGFVCKILSKDSIAIWVEY